MKSSCFSYASSLCKQGLLKFDYIDELDSSEKGTHVGITNKQTYLKLVPCTVVREIVLTT